VAPASVTNPQTPSQTKSHTHSKTHSRTNYHARWVIPVTRPPIAGGTVSVAGTRITYVGPRRDAPAGADIDLGDAVLMPGLVNAHTHLELTAMRGLLTGLEFVSWIRTLTAARAAVLTTAAMRDAACLGIAEGLLAGITTYADTSASGVVLGAMRDMGVRGIMYQEVFGPAAAQRAESMAQLRRDVEALRPLETDLVRLGVSPHAVYTVHEDLMIDAAAYAIGAGMPVAIHLAESGAETAFLREAEGPFAEALRARGIPVERRSHSPVHLLVELGVVLARPLLIHCVTLDASDVDFIADYGCPVAHCPASNAILGHGIAPVRELLDAGAIVGLGSDSAASNDQMDVLAEARLASLMQSARLHRPDAVSTAEALMLATLGGARALGLDEKVGSIDVGKSADLAAFALDPVRAATLGPEAAALAAAGVPAALVTVAGTVRVRDGVVVGLDPMLAGRVSDSAAALVAWRHGLPPH
jgi:cytosine/adenosine deaminase-related metal-dependent hydrolase